MTEVPEPASYRKRTDGLVIKLTLLALAVAVGGILYWQLGDVLSLEYLAGREAQLRAWQINYPVVAAATAIAFYVAIAGLSLPGAAVLTLVCGWYVSFVQNSGNHHELPNPA